MRKFILLCLVICSLFLYSCQTPLLGETSKNTLDDPAMIIQNWEDFNYLSFEELISETSVHQQILGNDIIPLSNYILEDKFIFSGHKLRNIYMYIPRDFEGNITGDHRISIYWWKMNCAKCESECLCTGYFNCNTYYSPGGFTDDIIERHERVSEYYYICEYRAEDYEHVFIVNENCFVRFNLSKDAAEYDEIVSVIESYSNYLRDAMGASEG